MDREGSRLLNGLLLHVRNRRNSDSAPVSARHIPAPSNSAAASGSPNAATNRCLDVVQVAHPSDSYRYIGRKESSSTSSSTKPSTKPATKRKRKRGSTPSKKSNTNARKKKKTTTTTTTTTTKTTKATSTSTSTSTMAAAGSAGGHASSRRSTRRSTRTSAAAAAAAAVPVADEGSPDQLLMATARKKIRRSSTTRANIADRRYEIIKMPHLARTACSKIRAAFTSDGNQPLASIKSVLDEYSTLYHLNAQCMQFHVKLAVVTEAPFQLNSIAAMTVAVTNMMESVEDPSSRSAFCHAIKSAVKSGIFGDAKKLKKYSQARIASVYLRLDSRGRNQLLMILGSKTTFSMPASTKSFFWAKRRRRSCFRRSRSAL